VLHPAAALARRNIVLQQLLKYDFISAARYDQASRQPLGLHVHRVGNGCSVSPYPWFCSYVESALSREIGHKQLLQGGLTVRTTLEPKVEAAAEAALRHYVPARNAAHVAGAEAVVQPGTGNILAIADSPHYGDDAKKGQSDINLAVDEQYGGGIFGRFEAGSTFKMFVLAAALKEGLPLSTSIYSPASLTNYPGYSNCAGDPEVYSPGISNAGGAAEQGTYNLITGTWFSVNTFYAQLEQRVGICNVAKLAESMGVSQGNGAPLQQFPSMVLGAQRFGLSALDMAGAYATVAAHGKFCPPTALVSVTDAKGQPVKLPQHGCTQALDPGLADTITSVLQGVLTHPGATAANVGDPGRPAAAKTGTSDNDDTSDFAGYVPQMAAFVSVGHPAAPLKTLDGVTLGGTTYGTVFGATIAGPIWKQTFETALRGVPVQSLPSSVSSTYLHGALTAVPDVSGVSATTAEATLRQDGFDPTVAATPIDSYLPVGTVAKTSPGAGADLPPGTPITIFLSNGQSPPLPSAPPVIATTPTGQPPATGSAPAGNNGGRSHAPPAKSPPAKTTPLPPPAHSHGPKH
jgi:membrane peptidoglycan carboxypeptidase